MTTKTIELQLDKEHKAFVSYTEADHSKDWVFGGTIYVRKTSLPFPLPQKIKLTLEA